MKRHLIKALAATWVLALGSLAGGTATAATLSDIYQVAERINQQARQSQARVDALTEETRELLGEYKTVLKEIEGLRVYNGQLERQIQSQEREMQQITRSIDEVTIIERQITPLMLRMIEGLEQFVDLDLPFLLDERRDRIEVLRTMMDRADVAVSEKFSQILQAYQIENEYGRTMESYSDSIPIDGTPRRVDVLKIGRVVLAYQSPDGELTGFYNPITSQWEELDDSYASQVRNGIRMANQQLTVDLLTLPVRGPEEVPGPQGESGSQSGESGFGGRRMSVRNMKTIASGLLGALLLLCTMSVLAQEAENQQQQEGQLGSDMRVNEAANLDELLGNVRNRQVVESRALEERIARFQRERNEQQQLLEQARNERTQEEQRSERLETTFEENEIRIGDLQEQLDSRLGSLRELFGVLQQVAGDTRGLFEASVISAQFPDRGEWLGELAQKMGTASNLATIAEMERLWFELQREMTASGKVVKFPATVVLNNGERLDTEVVRVGSFNLVTDGRYVKYVDGAIAELGRQPAGRFTSTTEDLVAAAPDEIVGFSIDPTRGSLLDLLIQGATLSERIGTPLGGITTGECYLPFCDGEGDYVGSVIILMGIFGIILGIWKLVQLSMISSKVQAQRKSDTPDPDNPLGRVLNVYRDNRDTDVETLELKLGEAILAETPKLTSNVNLIQVISVVAPLLGLLGTVVGMIITFQAITLFGAGDPQTMASGIAQALMTTVEGLVVAIPMTLLHAIVAQRSRGVIHVLEEQSAGLIAEHAERSGQALG